MKNLVLAIFFQVLCHMSLAQESPIAIPSQQSIKNFELKQGVYEASIKRTDKTNWEMMFSVPKIKEGETVDLVLALHWGVRSSGYEEFMECLILPAFKGKNYLIVAPFAEQQVWWASPKEDQIISLVKQLKSRWPIGKVIVTGYSDGASASIFFAKNSPRLFDAAIGIAGNYEEMERFKIPVYTVHGVGDQLFDYDKTKRVMELAKKNSEHVAFVTSEELTHYEACEYVPYLVDAIEWVEARIN